MSIRHSLHRLEKLLCRAGLEHVASGTGADRINDVGGVVVGRQHGDRDVGMGSRDDAGDLEAVDVGHAHIEQDDVRLLRLDHLERLVAVGRLPDHHEVFGRLEQLHQAFPRQLMIVRDTDPDDATRCCRSVCHRGHPVQVWSY